MLKFAADYIGTNFDGGLPGGHDNSGFLLDASLSQDLNGDALAAKALVFNFRRVEVKYIDEASFSSDY